MSSLLHISYHLSILLHCTANIFVKYPKAKYKIQYIDKHIKMNFVIGVSSKFLEKSFLCRLIALYKIAPLYKYLKLQYCLYHLFIHNICRLNSMKNTNFGLDNKKLFLMHWKITFADPSLKIRLSFEGTPTSSSPGVSAERSREGFSRTQWGWVPHLPTDYCVHSFDSELV